MPDSNQSPSDPGFLKESLRPALDVATGLYQTSARIVTSDRNPAVVAAVTAGATFLACLFPAPFAIAGVLHTVDLALNGRGLSKATKDAINAQIKEQFDAALAAAATPAPV